MQPNVPRPVALADLAKLRASNYAHSASKHLQTSKQWPVVQVSRGEGESVGLSTLLDISLSHVQSRPARQEQSRRGESSGVEGEVEEMREKLRRINQKPLQVKQARVYQPVPHDQAVQPEDKYLRELKVEIDRERMGRAIGKIVGVWVGKLCRELTVYHEIRRWAASKQKKLARQVLGAWAQLVKEEGQRVLLIQAIRERVIQKRRDRQLWQDIDRVIQ